MNPRFTTLAFLAFLIALIAVPGATAQQMRYVNGCSPDPTNPDNILEVTDQAWLDGWNCGTAVRNLEIRGPGIFSLAPLAGLSSVENLTIQATSLVDFTGLEGLTRTDAFLYILDNPLLTKFFGLDNLNTVSADLFIINNDSIQDVDGLEGLTFVGNAFIVKENDNLAGIDALRFLEQVAGGGFFAIENNPVLGNCAIGLASLIRDTPSGAFAPGDVRNFFDVYSDQLIIQNNFGGLCGSPEEVLNSVVRPEGPQTQAPPLFDNPARVISVYSDSYANVPVDAFSAGFDEAEISFEQIDGNNTLRYDVSGGFAAIELSQPRVDATLMTHFMMDVWTEDPTIPFAVKLVDFGDNKEFNGVQCSFDDPGLIANPDTDDREGLYDYDLGPGWTRVEIPLDALVASCTGERIPRSAISQILFEAPGASVWVDNMYFVARGPVAAISEDFQFLPSEGDFTTVELDGSASADYEGGPLTFEWTVDDNVVSTGAVASFELPDGNYDVFLTVTSELGDQAFAQSFVTIVRQVYRDYDLFLVDVNNGDVEAIPSSGEGDFNAHLSKDGKFVIYDSVSPFRHDIYVTELKTGEVFPLEGGEGGNNARYSPNGKMIVFDRSPAGEPNLYIVPDEGGTPTLIRENAIDADWSNNSKELVFRDLTDGSIRTIELKDGSETLIAPLGFDPAWSGNGKAIAYSIWPNLFVQELKKGEPNGMPRTIVDGFRPSGPSWVKKKDIVYHDFGASSNSDRDIYMVSAEGGAPTRLAGTVGRADVDPAASKNGKYVVYSGYADPTASKMASMLSSSALEGLAEQPESFVLDQNYPNPFNPSTTIAFELPESGDVRLTIFDMLGREVHRLLDGPMSAGAHRVQWNASANLPSGAYLYRLTAGGQSSARLMTLIK